MAREKQTKYVLTAEDRTRVAVESASRGLGSLDSRVLGLKSSLLGLAGALGAGSFTALVKSAINAQDELSKMSQKVGVSVELLSGLKYAGDLADVSLETMGTGLRQLAKNAQDASANLGEGRYAFDALGISVKDSSGHLKGTDEMLLEVSDKFAGMEDGAGKTALAMRLFGRAGADLIPLLNQGAAGIAATVEEARRLGVVFSGDAARAAEDFNDNLTRLKATFEGITVAIANSALPTMNKWVGSNLEAIKIAGSLSDALRLFVFNLDAMTTEKPAEEIKRLTKALEDYQAAGAVGKFMQSPTGAIFGGREQDLQKQIEFLKYLQRQQALEKTGAQYLDARDLAAQQHGPLAKAPGLTDPVAAAKAKAEADKAQAQRDLQAAGPYALAAQQEALFNSPGALEAQLAGVEKMNEEQAKAGEKLKDQVQPLRDINRERGLAVKLYKEGKVTAEELAARQAQLDDEAATALGNQVDKVKEATSAAKDFGLVMQSAASDAIRNWQGFSNLLKSIITDFAQMEFKKYALDPILKNAGGIFDHVFGGGGGAASTGVAEEISALVGGGGSATGIPYVPREGLYKLHAGEKVTNATDSKKAGGGGPQVFIDARGADAAAVSRLESLVRRLDGTFNQRAVAAVGDARRRGVNLAAAQ